MATTVIKIAYQLRRSTEQEWDAANPILRQGEPGFVIDKNKLKIGDGITAWNNLEYLDGEASITPDGDSVIVNASGALTIFGFTEALTGQIPMKGADGKIKWSDICLRRDNYFNYKADFVPQNGEVCLVDTPRDGLRAVCGDGVTAFADLEYIDDFIVRGYLYDGRFYKDSAHTQLIIGAGHKLYINMVNQCMFIFDGADYIEIGGDKVANASATVAGIMKLYDTLGQNTDGTITQRLFTDEINQKFEMDVAPEDEMLIFDNDIN